MHIPSKAPLPALGRTGFSLISLNVLLPNSVDGWWLYKYYPPNVPSEAHQWEARQGLLAELLLTADADIVCCQETCAASFESDFSFMRKAGYAAALLGKGRMRPATFWKEARFALCSADGSLAPAAEEPDPASVQSGGDGDDAPPALSFTSLPGSRGSSVTQGDRTLITSLKLLDEGGEAATDAPPLFVINCHLAAGPEGRRRLRQVHDSLEAVRKQRVKAKLPKDAAPPPVVVCGDFNSQGHSAVHELLVSGEVLPAFRESGDPTEKLQGETEVTSKPKRHALGKFDDAAAVAARQSGGPRGPTMYAQTLQPLMEEADGSPTPLLRAALADAFRRLSADGEVLTLAEQMGWLTTVNKALGRGSEWRAAEGLRASRGKEELTAEDFEAVYVAEMQMGKFWGVEHDLRLLRGGCGLAAEGGAPFTATFDYVYYTSDRLALTAVREPLDAEQKASLESGASWLPNEWHMSDHLPVGVALRFAE